MTEHENAAVARRAYDAFLGGDMATLAGLLAGDVVWHVAGLGKLNGDYRGHEAVFGFFTRLVEETGGTFTLEVHDILANDEHTVALVTQRGSRGGRSSAEQAVHVMHLHGGQIQEFWGATTDPETTLAFWS